MALPHHRPLRNWYLIRHAYCRGHSTLPPCFLVARRLAVHRKSFPRSSASLLLHTHVPSKSKRVKPASPFLAVSLDILRNSIRETDIFEEIPGSCITPFVLLLIELVKAAATARDNDSTVRMSLDLYMLPMAVLRRTVRCEEGWRYSEGQNNAIYDRLRRSRSSNPWVALWAEAITTGRNRADWFP